MEHMPLELSLPLWQSYNIHQETGLLFQNIDVQVGSYEYSSSSLSVGDVSDVSSCIPASETVYTDETVLFSSYLDRIPAMFPVDQSLISLDISTTSGDGHLMVDEMDDSNWFLSESSLPSQQQYLDDEVGSLLMSPISSDASMDTMTNKTSLVLPCNEMEIDSEVSMLHLLKAYGEATETGMKELAETIMRRLKEKSCPFGSALQRLAYYLIKGTLDQEVDLLRHEAGKNYESAFRAFYQILPYGRFSHLTANSVILQTIPDDAEMVHIVDFDIGGGVQWPPLIEALAKRGQRTVNVRLTAVKWEGEDCSGVSSTHGFQETKRGLCKHAEAVGLNLKVEEMDMAALMTEMNKTKTRNDGYKWLAFNCMAGLPHMGGARSVKTVVEFLKLAKDSINLHSNGNSTSRGTIVFGDGVGMAEVLRNENGYGSIFEGLLVQFQALLGLMETHFPHNLREARIAVECLFLMPYISSLTSPKMWEDIAGESKTLLEIGLECSSMRTETLTEAKELVRGSSSESLYCVGDEGVQGNQLVLGHLGTPLVKVSSWR